MDGCLKPVLFRRGRLQPYEISKFTDFGTVDSLIFPYLDNLVERETLQYLLNFGSNQLKATINFRNNPPLFDS